MEAALQNAYPLENLYVLELLTINTRSSYHTTGHWDLVNSNLTYDGFITISFASLAQDNENFTE